MAKRIQTGRLIGEAMKSFSSDFCKLDEVKRNYYYRRSPDKSLRNPELFYRVIIFTSSLKWKCFGVDVYTGVFPNWNRQYGYHHLRRATGLENLRLDSSAVRMEDVSYNHDGTEPGAIDALHTITNELHQYAQPWFDKAEKEWRSNLLVRFGRQWIEDRIDTIPSDVKDQIDMAFKNANGKSHSLSYPLLNELRDELRKQGSKLNSSKWDRQQITALTLDLFLYAQQLKK